MREKGTERERRADRQTESLDRQTDREPKKEKWADRERQIDGQTRRWTECKALSVANRSQFLKNNKIITETETNQPTNRRERERTL